MSLIVIKGQPTATTGNLNINVRTALVSMPFVSAFRPSIQLGLLKSACQLHGFSVSTFYPNLYFARLIGLRLYESLCQHRGVLLGDWLFSKAAFEGEAPDLDGSLLLNSPSGRHLTTELRVPAAKLLHIRDTLAKEFLHSLLSLTTWADIDVVGFTTTFEQNVASIGFARLLKSHLPSIKIVFGGANAEGSMGAEIFRRVPVIDYIVSGEGEHAFPDLLRMLSSSSTRYSSIPGVLGRNLKHEVGEIKPVSLDEIPVPDYSEYFATNQRALCFSNLPPCYCFATD